MESWCFKKWNVYTVSLWIQNKSAIPLRMLTQEPKSKHYRFNPQFSTGYIFQVLRNYIILTIKIFTLTKVNVTSTVILKCASRWLQHAQVRKWHLSFTMGGLIWVFCFVLLTVTCWKDFKVKISSSLNKKYKIIWRCRTGVGGFCTIQTFLNNIQRQRRMRNTSRPLHAIPVDVWPWKNRLKKIENSSQTNKGTHRALRSPWNNIVQSFDLQRMFQWNALAS